MTFRKFTAAEFSIFTVYLFEYSVLTLCFTSVAVLPLWLFYLCGCFTSVAVLPLWLFYLCGCFTSVAVLPLWLFYLCGCFTSVVVFMLLLCCATVSVCVEQQNSENSGLLLHTVPPSANCHCK